MNLFLQEKFLYFKLKVFHLSQKTLKCLTEENLYLFLGGGVLGASSHQHFPLSAQQIPNKAQWLVGGGLNSKELQLEK